MKKRRVEMFWERNKGLIIIGLIWIIVSIPILIFLCPKVDEMIQAEALITLVFVTMFYARQTKMLVEQEKKSLEEQKKKINADFEEKKLKEFYYPLKYMIFDLERIMKKESDPSKPTLRLFGKIVGLGTAYGHMITKELEDETVGLLNIMYEIKEINKDNVEELQAWKDKVKTKIEEVEKQKTKEIKVIREIIKETYGFFAEKLEKFVEEGEA
jgi:hypothetical protein